MSMRAKYRRSRQNLDLALTTLDVTADPGELVPVEQRQQPAPGWVGERSEPVEDGGH